MKTAETILKETYNKFEHRMADFPNGDTVAMICDAMKTFKEQYLMESISSEQKTTIKIDLNHILKSCDLSEEDIEKRKILIDILNK